MAGWCHWSRDNSCSWYGITAQPIIVVDMLWYAMIHHVDRCWYPNNRLEPIDVGLPKTRHTTFFFRLPWWLPSLRGVVHKVVTFLATYGPGVMLFSVVDYYRVLILPSLFFISVFPSFIEDTFSWCSSGIGDLKIMKETKILSFLYHLMLKFISFAFDVSLIAVL